MLGVDAEETEACAPLQAVYTSLKETETRATDLLPYWKVGPHAG